MKFIFKFIWEFLKFYYICFGFGVFAIIILFASADTLYFVQNNEFYILELLSKDNLTDTDAWNIYLFTFRTALNSLSGTAFFEESFGVAFDGVGGNIFSFVNTIIKDKAIVNELSLNFMQYAAKDLPRDFAVTSLSAIVMYAVTDLKDRIAKKSFAVSLGFALAAIFWILAAFTFAECVVSALENSAKVENRNTLYLILSFMAIGIETVIHAYNKKCSIIKLLLVWALKLIFIIIRTFLAWLMCKSAFAEFNSTLLPSFVLTFSLFFFLSLFESSISSLAEKKK